MNPGGGFSYLMTFSETVLFNFPPFIFYPNSGESSLNPPPSVDHPSDNVEMARVLWGIEFVRIFGLVRIVGGDSKASVGHPVKPFGPDALGRKSQDIDFPGLDLLFPPVHKENVPVGDPGLHRLARGLDHAEIFGLPSVLPDPVPSVGMGLGDFHMIAVVISRAGVLLPRKGGDLFIPS